MYVWGAFYVRSMPIVGSIHMWRAWLYVGSMPIVGSIHMWGVARRMCARLHTHELALVRVHLHLAYAYIEHVSYVVGQRQWHAYRAAV